MEAPFSNNTTKRIPDEIVDEILSRLPVKSLLQFKCVCKRWLSTISDPNFQKRESGSILLAVSSNNTHTFYTTDHDTNAVVNVFSTRWSNKRKKYFMEPVISNSCNGLVLVGFLESLFLFNPSTRYFVKVLTLDILQDYRYSVVMGLCYDAYANDYKAVVRGVHKWPGNIKKFVVAASLKTKEWTMIGFPFANVGSAREGPVVNGLMHWTVCDSTDDKCCIERKIIRFDARVNKFDDFSSPQSKFGDVNVIVGIGVLDGHLCMARVDNGNNFVMGEGDVEILILKEYGVVESWTTMFVLSNLRVNPFQGKLTPYLITKDGEVLLMKTSLLTTPKKVFCLYNPRTKLQRRITKKPFFENSLQAVSLVGSLVSPAGYRWDPIQHSEFGIIKREGI